MDLDPSRLQEKYDEHLRKHTRTNEDQEDLTDMVAEHSAKQNVSLFRTQSLSAFRESEKLKNKRNNQRAAPVPRNQKRNTRTSSFDLLFDGLLSRLSSFNLFHLFHVTLRINLVTSQKFYDSSNKFSRFHRNPGKSGMISLNEGIETCFCSLSR